MKRLWQKKIKFTPSLLNTGLVYRLTLVTVVLVFMWASIFLVLR